MDSIRFKLPHRASEACALRVSNAVGEDEVTHPSCNPPVPEDFPCYDRGNDPPPSNYYDTKHFHDANSSAVYYRGHLFFFSVGGSNIFHDPPIQVQRFENGKFVADDSEPSMPSGTTYATIVPLVIEDKLWVFVTGCNGGLYYTRYSLTGGWEDRDWLRIPNDGTKHTWEIAPAYNPMTGEIEVYQEYYGQLKCMVSEDFGSTWSVSDKPWLQEIPPISSAPSAVYYQEDSSTILALAVGIDGVGNVYFIDDTAEIFDHHVVDSVSGRPFLVDLDESTIALIWREPPGDNSYISKMDKATREWGAPYEPIGGWITNFPPNGFINYEPNGTGGLDRIFYLLWGYPDCTAGQALEVTWVMNRLENRGPVIEILDQSQPVSQSPHTVGYETLGAQIFTAGVSGELNRVSLRLENYTSSPPPDALLEISIQTVIEGLPSGEQVATGTIPFSAIPSVNSGGDWVNVDISAANVYAGRQYAIVLRTNIWNADVYWWFADECESEYCSSYTDGEMAHNYGNGWITDENLDFTFKTYVLPL
jgi:hypothetical protein